MRSKNLFFLCLTTLVFSQSINFAFANDFESLLKDDRFLEARSLLRKEMSNPSLSLRTWYLNRSLLFRYPEIGKDVLLQWESLGRQKQWRLPENDGTEGKLDSFLNSADIALFEKRYDEASALFERGLQWIDKRKQAVNQIPKLRETLLANLNYLRPYFLHGLARARFSNKNYQGAIETYSQIPVAYARFRQAMFEKMWTAFNAKKYDLALGAIAAQKSAYFSKYLEPETYLIQIYILKGLCRISELNTVINEIAAFTKALENGSFDYKDYSRFDIETLTLLHILV